MQVGYMHHVFNPSHAISVSSGVSGCKPSHRPVHTTQI
jgi:hypothetical protein